MSTGPSAPIARKTFWTFRIVGFLTAALIVAIPFLIPSESAVDPFWQRLLLAGIITGISTANIFIPFFKRHTYPFVYGMSFLVNAWLIELAFLNNFNLDYSPTVFICLFLTGILFKHFRLLLYFFIGLFGFSLCLYPLAEDPIVSPIFIYMIQAMEMAAIGFFMERQIREHGRLQLQEGRQRLLAQAAMAMSDEGIMISDPSGHILQYNKRFLEVWGLTEADMDTPEPRAGIQKALAQLEEPEVYDQLSVEAFKDPKLRVQQQVKLKNGRHLKRFSKPLFLEGKYLGRIWFFKDVTSVQREKENLAVLKSVFEVSNAGIIVTALNGQIIDYNQNFIDIWGLTPEMFDPGREREMIKHIWGQMRNAQMGKATIMKLYQNPEQDRSDLLHLVDGRILKRVTRVLRVDQKIEGRIWFYTDITRRSKYQEALEASELRNRAMVNAVPDLLFRMDATGRILDLKKPSGGVFQDLTFKPMERAHSVFPAEMAELVRVMGRKVLVGTSSNEEEIEVEVDGKIHDFEIRVEKSGQSEILAIVRDVTARKTTERELIQRNFELDSFVYRSSHDLKAPLNSLMGLIGLARDAEMSDELSQYINLMDRSVAKLDTFIRNLTDFSRITRLEVAGEEFEFEELVEETIEALEYMEHAKRIERRIQVQGSSPFRGDRFHIGVVLSNLISNAIKYQDHSKPSSFVEVTVTIQPQRAELTVRDNGIGIPKEHQDRMFELFFRASNQSFGSGLGLYITKNAIEKVEGEISFKSEEGQGSLFRVVLPNQLKEVHAN